MKESHRPPCNKNPHLELTVFWSGTVQRYTEVPAGCIRLDKLKHLFVFLVNIKPNMSLFLVCNYNYPHCQYCTYHSNVNEDPLSICLME